ncbi:MAG: putative quinol monooxygenase [Acidimicrobiales bacterium]
MPGEDIDLTVVTIRLDASEPGLDQLLGVLAKYVVVSRQSPGCRNIDLCHSQTQPGRFLIIEKWESPQAQRDHFDSPQMVEMADSCRGLLVHPPQIDLLEGLSAHDLK